MRPALYPVVGHDGTTSWYVLHAGRALAAVLADGPCPTQELLEKGRGRAQNRRTRLGDQVAGVHLLAAWFRRHPEERQRLIAL